MDHHRLPRLSATRLARARWALRRTRRGARDLAALTRSPDTTLGPVQVGGARLLLHTPRHTDAAAWREQRLAHQDLLEPFWGDGGDWAARHTHLAWVERCSALRSAARHGTAHPFVVLVDGHLVGEGGIDAIDLGTSTGELSVWLAPGHGGHDVAITAGALACLHAFDGPAPLERLLAPVAVGDTPAARLAAATGFRLEATLPRLRATPSGRTDHQLWVLHRSDRTTAALRTLVDEHTARPGSTTPRRTTP